MPRRQPAAMASEIFDHPSVAFRRRSRIAKYLPSGEARPLVLVPRMSANVIATSRARKTPKKRSGAFRAVRRAPPRPS